MILKLLLPFIFSKTDLSKGKDSLKTLNELVKIEEKDIDDIYFLMNEIVSIIQTLLNSADIQEQQISLNKLFISLNELNNKLVKMDKEKFSIICMSALELVYVFYGTENETKNSSSFLRLLASVIEMLSKIDKKLFTYKLKSDFEKDFLINIHSLCRKFNIATRKIL